MDDRKDSTNRLVKELLKMTGKLDQLDEGQSVIGPDTKSLLVVDDLAEHREVIRQLLRRASFATSFAATASEALAQIHAGARFDGYLLDCAMPDMDGFELATQIRRRVPEARIGFLTASSDLVELSTLVEESGAKLFLRKPEDMDTRLVGRLALWLGGDLQESPP